jgi:hypothetical protein
MMDTVAVARINPRVAVRQGKDIAFLLPSIPHHVIETPSNIGILDGYLLSDKK